ncbi:AraC family transcriptional regulator [bacterium M00.F.Ca.ET.228.01.1.1]|uniref:helix-turn-helix domain-containing protein n=1 Tax=Paraburkholderia phenoliruptrix TaxID=252970 RepID=UPI0010923FE8|nr:AraC family transcriptional regulator [Paraburkholderia phenoliruptrix]TGP45790.1 AraC family transcriptional regulator [bacterium M00.F.Ca.ET.228.01.1.1]TGS04298.1 AraC family transcriptional regulator [bacterium M00.F.Ca.ET.191.01.1.1]TGU07083.1 AraC family transcriptional regulator [bacterium M00.F.Ca.ET.155.01.1.1]MBW0448475.1 AraC family transcriptional regulator [Paraburkholderia phenoliruptrix]MBW9100663.1 AraC family transcriptional regulator [Paraburkholderia phenoliruptrix]
MARTDPKNHTSFWWHRHTPGLSLMRADFTTQQYAPHTHDGFVIAVTESGGSVIKSRGVTDEAKTSTLLVFNPAEAHSGSMGWSKRWRYRSLYLAESAIASVGDGLGIEAAPYFMRNVFNDPDLIARFLELHVSLEEGKDVFRERELLLATFGRLYERYGRDGGRIEPAPRDRVLLRVVTDLIHDRYADDLLLEDLSVVVGLTPFQLIGLFKRCLGLTPHLYLTQVRLMNAREHLKKGSPIADVAASTGFYDQSALTRHFKRCYGITPLQFAAAAASRHLAD